MRKTLPLLLLAALLAFLLSGCGSSSRSGSITDAAAASPGSVPASSPQASPPAVPNNAETPSPPAVSPEPSGSSSAAPPSGSDAERKLLRTAKDVMDFLRDRDLQGLAGVIDPDQGLRFSPYFHIDTKQSLVFQAGSLPAFKETDKRTWGSYDGSGEPISLDFRDYFEKFVYDQDFAGAPYINVNKLSGHGNTPYNGQEVYPDSSFVEFHFPGFDKSKEGMDWESLILVFRPHGDEWKLCAIVHGQWTI